LLLVAVTGSLEQLPAQDTAGPAEFNGSGGIILVIGAAGTAEYGQQFAAWAAQWVEVAGQSATPLRQIGVDSEDGASDREQLQKMIESVVPHGNQPLWLVLIGHGTFARGVVKFNLRGPDVTASELAQWLDRLERPVVVVNCASASGPFINSLSSPRRIVVTATRSGEEQNYARFGEYFARAIASPDSDLDHDDEVSVHEAFLRASAEVRQFYEGESRIATEHALIDDNGDGKGTPATMFRGTRASGTAKDGSALDGPVASRITLAPRGGRLPFTDEELKQREEIEAELDALRTRKDELSEQAYDDQLEPLLIRLAKLYQAAEQRLSAPEH
jgi:hypothetical protein